MSLILPSVIPGTDLGGCQFHSERNYSPEIQKAIEGVQFIAQHIKDADRDDEVIICKTDNPSSVSEGITLNCLV